MSTLRNTSNRHVSFIPWLTRSGGMKRTILIPFTFLLVLAFGSFWWILTGSVKDALLTVADDLALGAVERVSSGLSAYLSVPSSMVETNSIYLSRGAGLVGSRNLPPPGLSSLFAMQLRAFPSVAILSFGGADGEYVEAQRIGDLSLRYGMAGKETGGALSLYRELPGGGHLEELRRENYDPRSRPWYKVALTSDGAVWSEPYALVSDQDIEMAAVKTVKNADGIVLGVVSSTVSLQAVSSLLGSIEEMGDGVVAVLDSRDRLMALSSPDGLDPKTFQLAPAESLPGDTGLLLKGSLGAPKNVVSHLAINGSEWRTLATDFNREMLGWKIIAALPESRFLAPIGLIQKRMGFIFILVFLGTLGVAYLIAHGIAAPLKSLGQAASELGNRIEVAEDFQGTEASRKIIRSLSSRHDELGRLAKNLANLADGLASGFVMLRRSLQEKDMLLQEVHHRVKNNLQIVSSMMSLQENESSDPLFISAMEILRDRIGAMAAVHETLYSSGDFSRVPMDDYLERVVESLAVYGSIEKRVTLSVQQGGLSLSLDQAIPCGLIAVELVTNSIKHAFASRDSGTISLCMERSGSDILLWVKDNGVWQESKAGEKRKQGTGSLIVAALASQLDGVFSIDLDTDGTRTRVVFPDKRPNPAVR